MNIVSLFAGCGGLDLGFEKEGFNVIWANEFDKTIHETYKYNHPNVILNTCDIRRLTGSDIPDCDGIIGGPPCQPWSEGGRKLGLQDDRGRLFLDYIRIIEDKQPKFFLIENVPGLLSPTHEETFKSFISQLERPGYTVHYKLLDTADFGVAQNRKRVIIVGFRKDIHVDFGFPASTSEEYVTLRQAIGDLAQYEPQKQSDKISVIYNGECPIPNHDTYDAPFDEKFMSRNRVRSWNEPSFTIQAQAKNEPLHPGSPKMQFVTSKKRIFVPGAQYRRLSVRECARIQSFADDFVFFYKDIRNGYKMVGNAVPPLFAQVLARQIKNAFANNCTLEKHDTGAVMVVSIIESKNNDIFRQFLENSNRVEYYFGRSQTYSETFQKRIIITKYFIPVINGKINSVYIVESIKKKQRTELPHDVSKKVYDNDIRFVLQLKLLQKIEPVWYNYRQKGWYCISHGTLSDIFL